MMGFIMPAINPPFRDNIIPALVVFGILSATLLGIPDPLVNARENGIFRSYKINGIPSISILVIPALTTILHLIIMTVLITATAPFLFNAPLPVNWFNYILIFVVMAFACTGLSVLIGVVSPSSRMTVLWSQLIFVPSMLLGGLMLPHSMLPDAAGKVAQLLPATQAMNALNGLAMGRTADFSPWGSVVFWRLDWLSISLAGIVETPHGVVILYWRCWPSCRMRSEFSCFDNRQIRRRRNGHDYLDPIYPGTGNVGCALSAASIFLSSNAAVPEKRRLGSDRPRTERRDLLCSVRGR
jgi:ABC-2 type transport system permease protein